MPLFSPMGPYVDTTEAETLVGLCALRYPCEGTEMLSSPGYVHRHQIIALLIVPIVGACQGTVGSRDTQDGDASASRPADATAPQTGDSAVPPVERDASIPDSGMAAPDDGGPMMGVGTLSDRYPNDEGIGSDPAVLFADDFEAGWGRWDGPTADTRYLHLETDPSTAHAGNRYLRSTVTEAHLSEQMYISSSTRVTFDRRVDEAYWRFYARFPEIAPNPHHWVRFAAGDEGYGSSGLANTVPPGDDGFWFDFDANNDDQLNFYVYWYKMRSGRCNDGSTTPGCAGDQGNTYHYGNVFRPPGQSPFPRDRWFCVEIHSKANTIGAMDGELSFWIDDVLVGDYRTGHPDGTWLRDQFHTSGCEFSSCSPPVPFEGFDFRSSEAVGFKSLFLDAYYERDTTARKRAALEARGLTVSDAQTILYDDVVVATERIGCRR